ncbi:MAG: hypothetical protein AB1489_19040 [Acidobacteriota bacterium]
MRKSILILLCCATLAIVSKAQDVVKVSPNDYKLQFENQDIRIIKINVPPGNKTPTHNHPDSVVVILSPSIVRHTEADGKISQTPPSLKRGDIVFAPQVTHSMEQIGTTTFTAFQIELKKPLSAIVDGKKAASLSEPFKTVLNNGRVSAFDATIVADMTINPSMSNPFVSVWLDNGLAELQQPDGKKAILEIAADTTQFHKEGNWQLTNVGKTPLRLLIIELKK